MRKSDINFPHPLLSEYSKDYAEDCSFTVEVADAKEDASKFIVSLRAFLACKGLEDYISEEKAAVAVKVYCSATSYREQHVFDRVGDLKIEIPKNMVAKKLELQGYIISNVNLEKFCLSEHNPAFFSNATIPISKGDILAEAHSIQINIDDSELEKELSSIIVVENAVGLESLVVNYLDDTDGLIHIRMPENEYQEYFKLRQSYRRYGISRFLQSAVIVPALTEAIGLLKMEAEIKEYDPEYEEIYGNTVWADSIMNKCDEIKRDLTDKSISAYALANEILGLVTKDAVSELHKQAQEMYNNTGVSRMGGVD